MNEPNLAQRIYDNLNWAHIVSSDPVIGPAARPMDPWSQVQAVWDAPDRPFVEGLYLVLLCRPADPVGLDVWCDALACGMARAEVVRCMAQSEEARNTRLDVSWLSRLAPPRPLARRLLTGVLRRAWRLARGVWHGSSKESASAPSRPDERDVSKGRV